MRLSTCLILSVIGLVGGTAGAAQQTENKSIRDPRIQVSVQDGPNGTSVSVQNLYSYPITAYVVENKWKSLNPRPTPGSDWAVRAYRLYDSIAHPVQYKPINPDGIDTFIAFPASKSGTQTGSQTVALVAVIFSDGTSAGEPQWITKLVGFRKIYWTHLHEMLALAQTAQAQNETADAYVNDLQAARQARGKFNPATMDSYDWNAADALYKDAIGEVTINLQTQPTLGTQPILNDLIQKYNGRIALLANSMPSISGGQ